MIAVSILIHTHSLDEDTGSYRGGPVIVRHQDLAWNAESQKEGRWKRYRWERFRRDS
jgi:hypothetical protein